MPTTLLLIRHADHDRPGPHLVGRDDSVGLSPRGRHEAGRLAAHLSDQRLGAAVSSPSRRCRATAEIVAAPHGIAPEIDPDIDEIDFGAWRGRTVAELEGDPRWQRFNAARGSARIPGGETITALKARVGRALNRISDRHPAHRVALVSHGDIIRTAICEVLGLSLDRILRFEVAPASISTVELAAEAPRLLALNWVPDRRPGLPG